MNLSAIKSIYFIGIGGIGMSALARYFNSKGVKISGYDRVSTHLTEELIKEGIHIHFSEDINLIPKEADLVVYTPAIPHEHAELQYFSQHGYKVIKRSDLLEELTKDMFTIAVAGTHGKTTTSSMIAHLLKSSGYDCTALLGGVTVNYHSNFLIGKNNVVVVEADEYDRSFHKLHPDISVITSAEPDHLDIYGTGEEMIEAFKQFAHKLKQGGHLIANNRLSFIDSLKDLNLHSYSLHDMHSEYFAKNERWENGVSVFDFHSEKREIKNIHLEIAGLHNIENAVAAIAVGMLLRIPEEKIREALQTFKGVKRRFEYIIRRTDFIYIDDYAHHPGEIKAFLSSVKSIFPDKKITCVFQPHLYTRTRDFADGFAETLSIADELILLPVYPARELPIEGINSEMILKKSTSKEKSVVEKKDLLRILQQKKREVLVTVGAGDIDAFVEPIRELFSGK